MINVSSYCEENQNNFKAHLELLVKIKLNESKLHKIIKQILGLEINHAVSLHCKFCCYLRNNFAKLNVFFEALNYETIDQKKAYELPGLFGKWNDMEVADKCKPLDKKHW